VATPVVLVLRVNVAITHDQIGDGMLVVDSHYKRHELYFSMCCTGTLSPVNGIPALRKTGGGHATIGLACVVSVIVL
jgi:hypothetical protein